jgi:U2-associated protein SR140
LTLLTLQGYASVYSSDSAEESERERTVKGKLGKIARKRFEACLRGMSGIRAEIARAMEFAMQKADAAEDVGDLFSMSN